MRARSRFRLDRRALTLTSLMLFGWETWDNFVTAAVASHATYESGHVAFAGFVGPFVALLRGGTPTTAYAVQAGAALSAALLVGLVCAGALPCRSGRQPSLRRP